MSSVQPKNASDIESFTACILGSRAAVERDSLCIHTFSTKKKRSDHPGGGKGKGGGKEQRTAQTTTDFGLEMRQVILPKMISVSGKRNNRYSSYSDLNKKQII